MMDMGPSSLDNVRWSSPRKLMIIGMPMYERPYRFHSRFLGQRPGGNGSGWRFGSPDSDA